MHVEYLSYGHSVLCIGYQVLQPQPIKTKPTNNKNMKRIQKTLVIGAMAALPIGVVTAGPIAGNASATSEIKAADAETKTVELKVTGMT